MAARSSALGTMDFNPRSPHGERLDLQKVAVDQYHFNPRSPHGERRAADDQRVAAVGISTHAPRTGSDPPCARWGWAT